MINHFGKVMLSKAAIAEFNSRKINNWDFIKSLSRKDLEEEFEYISNGYKFKLKLYDHQLACFMLGLYNPSFLFLLDMGLGKAQPLDSKILTPNGWVTMGDIKEGDYVVTSDGRKSKVSKIFEQGKKNIYKVIFNDRSSTKCCEEHLWQVITSNNKKRVGKWKIKSLKEIKDDLVDTSGNLKHFIPTTKPVMFGIQKDISMPLKINIRHASKLIRRNCATLRLWEKDNIFHSDFKMSGVRYYDLYRFVRFIDTSKEPRVAKVRAEVGLLTNKIYRFKYVLDPYLLGLLLGDGCITAGIRFSSSDKQLIDYVENLLPENCKLKKESKYDYKITCERRKDQNLLLDALRYHKLFGKRSEDKFIPNCYKLSSIKNRISILQGLLDTDGYISSKGLIQFSSSSKQLVEDVSFLVHSLGGVTRFSTKKTTHLDHYIIILNMPDNITPFRLKRKKERFNLNKKYKPARGFKKIEYVGKEEAKCIKIEDPNGLYITDDFIVTHNTAVSLHLLAKRIQDKKINKALVLTPNVAVLGSWVEETKKHTELTTSCLIGEKEGREEALNVDADLYIMNYGGLQVMMTDFVPIKDNKGKSKNKRVPNKTKVRNFINNFDAVIYDEVHGLGQRDSLVTTLSLAIAKNCKYKYGLTGTPFNRDLMKLWSLFNIIDQGETLGHNITFYRGMYFDQKINYWGGYEYTLKKDSKRKLYKRIKHKSIRYDENECYDLPPVIRKKITIPFPAENYKYYREAIDEIIEAKGNYKALKSSFTQLRQISSGFIGFKNDEEESLRIRFDKNPKLDALIELINEINGKVIVFNEFITSGDMICERLKKDKIKFIRLYGGTKVSEKKTFQKRFTNNKTTKVAVINSASGGAGLNLQVSQYGIFYESNPSNIIRTQAEKRFSGARQPKRSFIFDLLMKKSIEFKILKYHKEGKDLFDAVISGKVKLK